MPEIFWSGFSIRRLEAAFAKLEGMMVVARSLYTYTILYTFHYVCPFFALSLPIRRADAVVLLDIWVEVCDYAVVNYNVPSQINAVLGQFF